MAVTVPSAGLPYRRCGNDSEDVVILLPRFIGSHGRRQVAICKCEGWEAPG
jgi:hypothetical protein